MLKNIMSKKMIYQFVIFELGKVIYEMHSRKAKKVKFEIHKRTGKFVVYLEDSVYKDINFKYGFTLARELYRFTSGKSSESEIDKDMARDIDFNSRVSDKALKKVSLPLLNHNSIEYSHKHKGGDIFEVSLEWRSLKPKEQLIEKLSEIREQVNEGSHKVVYIPEDKRDFEKNEDYIVEEINLNKFVIYYESGARFVMDMDAVDTMADVNEIVKSFIVI